MQEKMFEEIETNLGSKTVELTDQEQTPYACAFIEEVKRTIMLGPLAEPRLCTRDTEFEGYHFPAGTQIIFNPYLAHLDNFRIPQMQPNSILNDTWMNPDISNRITKNLFFFGKGKRPCPGKTLASLELYLTFTSMIRKFKFSPVLWRYSDFGLCFQLRDNSCCKSSSNWKKIKFLMPKNLLSCRSIIT